MDYEKDITIDCEALDIEWLDQAVLARKYINHYAFLKKKWMLAQEKVKIVKAELIKQANDDPDKYLGEGVKPTNPNVEAYYRTHPRHKQAKEEWIEAQYEMEMAEGAKGEICNTRKKALENLVILHGQSYFAGPRVPRDLSKEYQERKERQKRVDETVATKSFRRLK